MLISLFLYCRYLLVDFGLAQHYISENLKKTKQINIQDIKIQNIERKISDEVK